MSVEAKIVYVNESFLRVDCEFDVAKTINDHFTLYPNGYQWDKRYRAGIWDGKVRLFRLNEHKLYVGLLQKLVNFLTKLNISFSVDPRLRRAKTNFSEAEIQKFIATKMKSKLENRPYQIWSVQKALEKNRCVLVSPTASGKSFILYVMMNILLYLNKKRKILLIVPSIGLVEQMFYDFVEYASNLCDYSKYMQKIFGGQSKDIERPITISTWQSLQDMPEEYFEQFNAVLVDECHSGTDDSKTVTRILCNCINAKYRIGVTGTLDCSNVHELVLEGIFGPTYQFVTTKQLIDQNYLSPLIIKTLMLKYPKEECQLVHEFQYQTEMKYIRDHMRRHQFMINFVSNFKKENALVLFRRIEFGKSLFDKLKARNPKDNIFFVFGGTPVEDREQVRKITEQYKNVTIIASYGVFSTGVNIKNLPNVIFAEPMKSKIKVLQSIGRGLRKHKDKSKLKIYDIVDCFKYKSKNNYAIKHYKERERLYVNEQFEIKVHEIKI